MSGSVDQHRGKERTAGLLLIAGAALALGLANSPLAGAWHHLLEAPLGIVLPRVGMLTPHLLVAYGLMAIFFLLVVNLVYAAFETFSTILALTGGGPGKATETLIVKVYRDGVVNLDLGSSSAQSVILMVAVILLTAVQFRFMGRQRAD